MKILVTGAAGFIGAATAEALLQRGDEVVGADNLNAYYDPGLKRARLARLAAHAGFRFIETDLADRAAALRLFAENAPQRVVHLAAQAGVRYGLEDPHSYGEANLAGFLNVLEGCRSGPVDHLVFASSSAVYGADTHLPFSASQRADHPLSLYGATKRANELMAHAYAHLYALPVTGLRFFTVYGPWGRPDMALFTFTRAILAGEPIELFNEGRHARDFTYIGDAVAGILGVLDRPAKPDPDWDSDAPHPASSAAPYRIYNLGSGRPVSLADFVGTIEKCLGRPARKVLLPLQPGDIERTAADIGPISQDIGYRPQTSLAEGVARFVDWYREFYGV